VPLDATLEGIGARCLCHILQLTDCHWSKPLSSRADKHYYHSALRGSSREYRKDFIRASMPQIVVQARLVPSGVLPAETGPLSAYRMGYLLLNGFHIVPDYSGTFAPGTESSVTVGLRLDTPIFFDRVYN